MFRDENELYDEIESYKNLIQKQKDEIVEREMIIDALTNALITRVRKVDVGVLGGILKSAWLQQIGNKEGNDSILYIQNELLADLFEAKEHKDVKFAGITAVGYDGFAYNIKFTYKGYTFELRIPNVSLATAKNLPFMSYGKCALTYEKPSGMWEHITASYHLEDIANAIKDFVEKKGA